MTKILLDNEPNNHKTMAVKIRMQRFGAKATPVYRMVVADSRRPRERKWIEEIGTYEPSKPGENFLVNLDRAQYWVSQGAQPSDAVTQFIRRAAEAAGLGFMTKPASPRVRKLGARDQDRLNVLLAKNNEGLLSEPEQIELNDLAKIAHQLTIRNAKAIYSRRKLGDQTADAVAGRTMPPAVACAGA